MGIDMEFDFNLSLSVWMYSQPEACGKVQVLLGKKNLCEFGVDEFFDQLRNTEAPNSVWQSFLNTPSATAKEDFLNHPKKRAHCIPYDQNGWQYVKDQALPSYILAHHWHRYLEIAQVKNAIYEGKITIDVVREHFYEWHRNTIVPPVTQAMGKTTSVLSPIKTPHHPNDSAWSHSLKTLLSNIMNCCWPAIP